MIKNKLKAGDTAPLFSAETWNGEPATLEECRGKKVWLAFFRYASCPLCNLRIHEMIERIPQYESANLSLITVFQSPPEKMAAFVGKQDAPFPLISDPAEELYRLYGLGATISGFLSLTLLSKMARAAKAGVAKIGAPDGTVTRIPGDFLIDEKGIIQDVFHGKDIGDHIPFQRVDSFAGL